MLIVLNNKKCPFCRKRINKSASICNYCNRVLIENLNSEPVKKETHSPAKETVRFLKENKQRGKKFLEKYKNIVEIIAIICALLIIANSRYYNHVSCNSTKGYSVGAVDSRFNISKEEVISLAGKARDEWNKAIGKPLLEYGGNNDVTINLVFDDRQEKYNKVKQEEAKIKEQEQTLNREKAFLESDTEKYNNDLSDFNREIDYWNDTGGLEGNNRSRLERNRNELAQTQEEIDQRTEVYNAEVAKYNELLSDIKSQISAKNKEEEEIGVFERNKKSITIYRFDDKNELSISIAHEFGHALGIEDHTADTNSIMHYIFITGQNDRLVLQPEDIAAFKKVCSQ
jgi:hypothetical protein